MLLITELQGIGGDFRIGGLIMDNLERLKCKHEVRPCMLLECLYLKTSIRKNAITSYHPAVRNFIVVSNELNTAEYKTLDSIDNETIFDMLKN